MYLPSTLPALATHHIDLWSIDPTQLSTASIEQLSAVLSQSETDNILLYKHKNTQHTAFVTRSICRMVLAQYTLTSPSALSFVRNKHGKPELANNINDIRFNLSHNNEQIVIAVCVHDNVGCDIESPFRKINIEPITRRYFSTQEHNALCALKDEQQRQRFFEYWTLKEAFVKAIGMGIGLGLDTFHFSFHDAHLAEKIKVGFNAHYPLEAHASWQFFQAPLNTSLLAICRESPFKQHINFLDARTLIHHCID